MQVYSVEGACAQQFGGRVAAVVAVERVASRPTSIPAHNKTSASKVFLSDKTEEPVTDYAQERYWCSSLGVGLCKKICVRVCIELLRVSTYCTTEHYFQLYIGRLNLWAWIWRQQVRYNKTSDKCYITPRWPWAHTLLSLPVIANYNLRSSVIGIPAEYDAISDRW